MSDGCGFSLGLCGHPAQSFRAIPRCFDVLRWGPSAKSKGTSPVRDAGIDHEQLAGVGRTKQRRKLGIWDEQLAQPRSSRKLHPQLRSSPLRTSS
eukprot:bmy_11430T0